MSNSKRPELTAPPEIFYDEAEVRKYTNNSRVMEVQQEMSERAVELLELEEGKLVLDIGCGSGLSTSVLEENSHFYVGLDISKAMIDEACDSAEGNGNFLLGDMGEGLPFRPGTFDGAISISAVQWLCNAEKRGQNPVQRLYKFFTTLYASLVSGGRAVIQFYPQDQNQEDLITSQAKRAGFHGGLVVDFPESTKKKKSYLVIESGGGGTINIQPLSTRGEEPKKQIDFIERRQQKSKRPSHPGSLANVKKWINEKKERRKQQGKQSARESKYTGRPRSGRF